MPNIFERLGLAEDAGIEEIAERMLLRDGMCMPAPQGCPDMACGLCKRDNATALLAALCAREYERGREDGTHVHSVDIAAVYGYEAGLQEAWERMREYCPSSIQTDNTRWRCWIQRDEQMALKPCEYAPCPLLRDAEKGDNP